MKINKIAGICKRAGMIRLYDEHTGDMQWCGTDAAIYPLYSLPVLDSDNVGPVMNFSDKELKNIVVEHVRIADCPMCCDFCPAPDDPGVCEHEDRHETTDPDGYD